MTINSSPGQLVTGVKFLAMLVPHIALRYEVKIRSYGALSTTIPKRFGWIQKEERSASAVITVEEAEEESEFVRVRRRNWARLIRKVAQDDVIEKILKCRGEWRPPWEHERPPRGPPKQLEIFGDHGGPVPIWNPDDENQDPPGDAWLE